MKQNCGNCHYQIEKHCQRFPPQIFSEGLDNDSFSDYPGVDLEAWCGEWKEKDNFEEAKRRVKAASG